MRPILRNLKPASGVSRIFHLFILVILPILVLVLVRLDFVQLALSVVVLSKWRMFAVKPRFWAANARANSVDIMVGLALVLFMAHSGLALSIVWAALYAIWLIIIKPKSSQSAITAQAFIGQLLGLSALFLVWADGPVYGITLLSGLFCFLAARHFFDAFDEPHARMLSYMWGYFGAALGWLLSHWLIFYKNLAQPTLLLCVIGFGLALVYYFDQQDKLNTTLRRQLVFIMLAIVIVVVAFSDWGNKVV